MGSRLGTSVVLGLALAGCGGSAPRPAAAPAASLATRAEDAVHVSFYARTKERWTLRSAQGGILCPLPCAGWVGAEAGLVLVEDDFLVDGQPVTFPVPSQLPAVAGEDLVVTVDRTHAWGTKKVGFPRGAVVRPLWPAPAFRRSSAVPGLAPRIGVGLPMLKTVKAWIDLDGSHELGAGPRQSPENQEEAYPLSRCMTCGCCLEACPQVNAQSNFIGPAALNQVRLFNLHPSGKMHAAQRLEAVMGEGGVAGCGKAQNCVEVCPKEIPLVDSIAVVSRQATKHMLFGWLLK